MGQNSLTERALACCWCQQSQGSAQQYMELPEQMLATVHWMHLPAVEVVGASSIGDMPILHCHVQQICHHVLQAPQQQGCSSCSVQKRSCCTCLIDALL